MPDVYKGKSYMTEEYYEKREIENTGAAISAREWIDASKKIALRDKELIRDVMIELESELKEDQVQ